MKISASILAANKDWFEYAKELKNANVDCLHIDNFQNDPQFSIWELDKFDSSFLPLDVHLIYEHIEDEIISLLNKKSVRYLNIQYENLRDKSEIVHVAKQFKGKFGIGILAKTPLDIIEKYEQYLSQVLFMCSEPGKSGAEFDESNYERINYVHAKYPNLNLYADGGINDEVSKCMAQIGVSMVVSGSYLSNNKRNMGSCIYKLKYGNKKNVSIRESLLTPNELPIVGAHTKFVEIINVMNKFRYGVVFVVENEKFQGIISDGDIRRSFLKYEKEIFDRNSTELMNATPFCALSSGVMEDIYNKLPTMHRGIDIVPIVENEKLIGAVDLHIGV